MSSFHISDRLSFSGHATLTEFKGRPYAAVSTGSNILVSILMQRLIAPFGTSVPFPPAVMTCLLQGVHLRPQDTGCDALPSQGKKALAPIRMLRDDCSGTELVVPLRERSKDFFRQVGIVTALARYGLAGTVHWGRHPPSQETGWSFPLCGRHLRACH